MASKFTATVPAVGIARAAADAAGRERGRMGVSKAGHSLCAPMVLATLLLSAVASAVHSQDAFEPRATHRVFSHIIVAQTFHAPPGVPGSTGSSNDSHAPPPVPGSTGAGSSSNGSHAAPPVPGSTDSGGSSGGSHAPPPVPGSTSPDGASAGSHAPPPAPDSSGSGGSRGSHAPPPVPGGNP